MQNTVQGTLLNDYFFEAEFDYSFSYVDEVIPRPFLIPTDDIYS